MINRVNLKNYGPFKRLDIGLHPLNVVVGPNASGKTKLLELLSLVGTNFDKNTLSRMRRKGADGEDVTVSVSLSNGGIAEWGIGNTSFERKSKDLLSIFLRLDPEKLRMASYIDSPQPLMDTEGYGLATMLAYLKLNDASCFDELLRRCQQIVPNFERIRFKRTQVNQTGGAKIYGDELAFDMQAAPDLPPEMASEGTLLTLGLLAFTMEFLRRRTEVANSLVFLIDDLERGLHPRALGGLLSQLRRLTESGDIQIIATSHSPYLLDSLRTEEVLLTGFLDDASVAIRPLTSHPDFDRWKDEMTPGEMWSLVGEDWIK